MNTDTPASAYSLDHVSNDELHQSTRRLVGRSNQLLAALLAHLGEVEARGLHRERLCTSLCAYCVFELRMSEDAAFRRARAAKLAREFPIVLEQIAAGEIHLTGLLLLGPHLTEHNHRELLALARHRTKRDIVRLIRRIDPQPDSPASIEPLGPPPVGQPIPKANPSWEDFVDALSPPVRELPPGDNPREWTTTEAPNDDSDLGIPEPDGAPPALPKVPERYKVQFTASQEYVDLVQQAKDLASHALPSGAIEQLHLQAMRLLVAELKKRRRAALKPSRAVEPPRQRDAVDPPRERVDANPPRRQRGESAAPLQRGEPAAPLQRGKPAAPLQRGAKPLGRRRREHVPAAVRRAVWSRAGARCTYVDSRGERCRETAFIELHHVHPHARGGPSTEANLTLRCRMHNALAAEQDFGREFMEGKRRRGAADVVGAAPT